MAASASRIVIPSSSHLFPELPDYGSAICEAAQRLLRCAASGLFGNHRLQSAESSIRAMLFTRRDEAQPGAEPDAWLVVDAEARAYS